MIVCYIFNELPNEVLETSSQLMLLFQYSYGQKTNFYMILIDTVYMKMNLSESSTHNNTTVHIHILQFSPVSIYKTLRSETERKAKTKFLFLKYKIVQIFWQKGWNKISKLLFIADEYACMYIHIIGKKNNEEYSSKITQITVLSWSEESVHTFTLTWKLWTYICVSRVIYVYILSTSFNISGVCDPSFRARFGASHQRQYGKPHSVSRVSILFMLFNSVMHSNS